MKRKLSNIWRIVLGTLVSATVLPVSVLLLISNPPGSVTGRGSIDPKDYAAILTAIAAVICGPLNLYLAWRADRRNGREMELKLKILEQELETMKRQAQPRVDQADN